MPTPHRPPRPPQPRALQQAALAALLCAAPHARAADGFTEIGIDPPGPRPRPGAHAARHAAEDDQAAPPADDTDWAAWWRELRAWTPFPTPDPAQAEPDRQANRPLRLGGAATGRDPGEEAAFPAPWLGFVAAYSATSLPIPLPSGPATAHTPGEEEITTATLATEDALALFTGPPAPAPPPPIPEPGSMALLGGALVALGLYRRRAHRAPR